MRKICKHINLIIALPKTIFWNFYFFGFLRGVKLPMLLAMNAHVRHCGGKIVLLGGGKFGTIRVGFHENPECDNRSSRTYLDVDKGGRLIFKDDAHIGRGAIIHVASGAQLELGENFAISGSTKIICSKRIIIGDNVQFAWNSLVLDSDAHAIFSDTGERINKDKMVILGNNIWVGCDCIILKGTEIKDNTVVGAGSKLSKRYDEGDCIITGNPAVVVKKIGYWRI